MATVNNSSNVSDVTHDNIIDEDQVEKSIDFFTNDTGDKITKNDEVVAHLQNIETQSDNGGFSPGQLDRLVGVAVGKAWPATLARKLLSCLIPSSSFSGSSLASLAIWSLGDLTAFSRDCIHIPVLRILMLCVEYDCLSSKNELHSLYELFLSLIKKDKISSYAAALLIGLTTKKDVTLWRVRVAQHAQASLGRCHGVDSLLWKYRTLRPDLVPNCQSPAPSGASKTAQVYRRFHKVWQNRVDALNKEDSKDSLGWDNGQLSSRVIFKKAQRDCLLPATTSVSFASSIAQRKDKRIPTSDLKTSAEIHENAHQLQLPTNLLSLLGCRSAWQLLKLGQSTIDLIERFSITLYHTLHNEFLAEGCDEKGGVAGREKRRVRQGKLLHHMARLQEWLQQGVPVIGRFLSEFLANWDGVSHFLCVMRLLVYLQITDFRELNDCVLEPLEAHFRQYTTTQQVMTLGYLGRLLQHWVAVEYHRFVDMGMGFFPLSTVNCETPFQSIVDLGKYIGELATLALSQCREGAPNKTLLVSEVLVFYRTITKLLLAKKVPVRLDIPPSFIHEALFSLNPIFLSHVCQHFVFMKVKVIPELRKTLRHYEDGERENEEMALNVRSMIEQDALTGLSVNTREMMMFLSPGGVSSPAGGLFKQDWIMEEDLTESLFLCYHPAFLPFVLMYFKEEGVAQGEDMQTAWTNLGFERGESSEVFMNNSWEAPGKSVTLGSKSFYGKAPPRWASSVESDRGQGSSIQSHSPGTAGNVDNFLKFLASHLPAITDFIKTFNQAKDGQNRSRRELETKKQPLSSAKSGLSEDSGVSSQKTSLTPTNPASSSRQQRASRPTRTPLPPLPETSTPPQSSTRGKRKSSDMHGVGKKVTKHK